MRSRRRNNLRLTKIQSARRNSRPKKKAADLAKDAETVIAIVGARLTTIKTIHPMKRIDILFAFLFVLLAAAGCTKETVFSEYKTID